MNLRSTRGRDDPEINFIPLIDVLLVILIFLMVTTTGSFASPAARRRRSASAPTLVKVKTVRSIT